MQTQSGCKDPEHLIRGQGGRSLGANQEAVAANG